jgi:hypothetical protein
MGPAVCVPYGTCVSWCGLRTLTPGAVAGEADSRDHPLAITRGQYRNPVRPCVRPYWPPLPSGVGGKYGSRTGARGADWLCKHVDERGREIRIPTHSHTNSNTRS